MLPAIASIVAFYAIARLIQVPMQPGPDISLATARALSPTAVDRQIGLDLSGSRPTSIAVSLGNRFPVVDSTNDLRL